MTHTFSGLLAVGDAIASGQWIVVGDLIYDEGGFIHIEANDTSPDSDILGNAGEVFVKHTWDTVSIPNLSDRRLVINDINAVLLTQTPLMEIAIDVIHDNARTFPAPLPDPRSPQEWTTPNALSPKTFDFDVVHKFPPTNIEIRNEGIAAPSDIYLDGDIENPIGRTYVKNTRGSIFSDNANDLDGIEGTGVDGLLVAIFSRPGADTDYELIRTNKLVLDADAGAIGRQAGVSGPRVPVASELVRFKHIDPEFCPSAIAPCLYDIVIQIEATGDLVADLTGNERSLTALASSVDWQLDYLVAGNDIDVVINDTVQGVDVPTLNGLTVALYDPPNGIGAPPFGSPSPNPPTAYQYHFRPDSPAVDYDTILRAFGVAQRSKVTSTWTFGDAGAVYGDVRAGDDIKTATCRHATTARHSTSRQRASTTATPATRARSPTPRAPRPRSSTSWSSPTWPRRSPRTVSTTVSGSTSSRSSSSPTGTSPRPSWQAICWSGTSSRRPAT